MEKVNLEEKRIIIASILEKAKVISSINEDIKITNSEEGDEAIYNVDRLDHFLNRNCIKLSRAKSIKLISQKYSIEKDEAKEIYEMWRKEYVGKE